MKTVVKNNNISQEMLIDWLTTNNKLRDVNFNILRLGFNYKWGPPRYNWNSVVSGVKHHKTK